jgi:hypothetical protein
MRVNLFGLVMDAPRVTFFLWSPWRCTALEHRLFDALKSIPAARLETDADECRLHLMDPTSWKLALQHLNRVLKGWQEEANDVGKEERRSWRWLLEADVDANGYDMQGEKANFWAYLRLSLDRGGPGDPEKGEDIDLNGLGLCVWGSQSE